MFYRRHKHKKHKNREPWSGTPFKTKKEKRCFLSKEEYDLLITKVKDSDCSAVVISVK
jgi:hypothetical protein